MDLERNLDATLLNIRNAYYVGKQHQFSSDFKGIKIGPLENRVLTLLVPDGNADRLNAGFARIMLVSMQANGAEISQVVFANESTFSQKKTQAVEKKPEDDVLTLEVTYSGEYEAIVRPERIVAVPRYFLRHISRMGAENAWLYMGFRQAAYQAGVHRGVRQISISAPRICKWAGMHRSTFWRKIANPETWQGLKGFVRQGVRGEWTQENEDGRPHRDPNRYTVSMTIPLIPSHVISLRSYLVDEAERYGIEEAAANALSVPPDQLLRDIPGQANCDPMTVYQVVTSLGGSSKAASALQAHLMSYSDVVILSHYFIETWLPKIKPGASWMILWMQNERGPFNEFTASLQEIMALTGMTREKTIREWLLDAPVRLFVYEDPKVKTRGATSQRRFIVRESVPLISELVGNATITEAELDADATHREDETAPDWARLQLGAIATIRNDELGAIATIRDDQLGAISTTLPSKNNQLGAIATIRKAKSASDWARLRLQLGAIATVKGLINKNISHVNIDPSTTINYYASIHIKGRGEENAEALDNHDECQEPQAQQGVVDGPDPEYSGDPADNQEAQAQQGVVEESGIEIFPENDSGEIAEIEPADPQRLFQQILKHANVTPKIQQRIKGKPFYPFLCWLIYGASLEPIDDPVGFAISRYGQGLPDSQEIKDLARDLDGLLGDLDYFKAYFILSNQLHRVFGENLDRVRLLANIIGD